MRMKYYILLIMGLLTLIGCKSREYSPAPVASVDVSRYVGLWYEIASNPATFTKGCQCTTAEYTLRPDGSLTVVNKCRRGPAGSKQSSITGKAWAVEGSGNARLKVQFFWPIRAPYWIVALDSTDYKWAAVSGPGAKYLWILSRTPQMDETLYQNILSELRQKGINLSALQRTPCN
jgi:apolipoprotein D and lipocalin family protein